MEEVEDEMEEMAEEVGRLYDIIFPWSLALFEHLQMVIPTVAFEGDKKVCRVYREEFGTLYKQVPKLIQNYLI